MKQVVYNKNKAIEYARKWAYSRNPKYYNFDLIGGDCTNFVSQCIFEGCPIMNVTKDIGWYYKNGNDKSPSWTGVQFLYNFLTKNYSVGPYGKQAEMKEVQEGDIVQLSFNSQYFSHSLIVTKVEKVGMLDGIRVASHTEDNFNKKLNEYNFQKIRFVHIEGGRSF